eukprot:CAMPEP_0198281156 /NCGR_PEP_ID=MMETSP1449-20131203/1128_1 /TAXON_ID=420275 /ORGANISM="Attheya septentrionalis, Strain CCMP2084" /LENGTH=89 /DNA_ID=CAMNT_0043976795 /DNA_START=139 /DNA_END=409 /DNA_ORIENTATION=-
MPSASSMEQESEKAHSLAFCMRYEASSSDLIANANRALVEVALLVLGTIAARGENPETQLAKHKSAADDRVKDRVTIISFFLKADALII